jgi:hypothetical protein
MTMVEAKKILQKSILTTCNATKKGLTFGINANIAVLELCDEMKMCPKKL